MTPSLKKPLVITLGLAVLASAAFADAHADKALNAAVEARQSQMQVIGYSTGVLGDMAKGERPYDATLAASAARNINTLTTLDRASLWIEGTEQGAVGDSRAKAEIWSNADGFAEKMEGLQTVSASMIDAAGTDLDGLKAAMGDLGKACGACHDDFRGPKN